MDKNIQWSTATTKYNENLKSNKAKYQINYSYLYDPNEILKLTKKTKNNKNSTNL